MSVSISLQRIGALIGMLRHEKSCGALIFRGERDSLEFLLLKSRFGGHWSFPKGHMELGESEVQTALREVREETGLSIQLLDGFRQCVEYYPKPNIKKQVVYFLGSITDPSAVPVPQKEEVSELKWMNFQEAFRVVTFKNDRKLLDKAIEFLGRNIQ